MLMSFIGTFPNALILIDCDRDDEMLADQQSASNMQHLDRKFSTVRSFVANFEWHDILHEMALYMVHIVGEKERQLPKQGRIHGIRCFETPL